MKQNIIVICLCLFTPLNAAEAKIARAASGEQEEIRTKVHGLIDQRSYNDEDLKFKMKRMAWDITQAALEHFPNKEKLKVFTSIASGDLGYEDLILRALAIAGFTIDTINLIDPFYPLGFFPKNSTQFHPVRDAIDLGFEPPTASTRSTLEAFKKDFVQCTVNVFPVTAQYTCACLDAQSFKFGTDSQELKADLIWQSHFRFHSQCGKPGSEPSYMKGWLAIRVQAYKKRFPEFAHVNFDCISHANAQPYALFLRNLQFSVLGHVLPEPDIDFLAFHKIAIHADYLYRADLKESWPSYITETEKDIKKVAQQIEQLPDQANRAMLTHYVQRFIARFKQAQEAAQPHLKAQGTLRTAPSPELQEAEVIRARPGITATITTAQPQTARSVRRSEVKAGQPVPGSELDAVFRARRQRHKGAGE